jgi:hypothetical protein
MDEIENTNLQDKESLGSLFGKSSGYHKIYIGIIATLVLMLVLDVNIRLQPTFTPSARHQMSLVRQAIILEEAILPAEGVILPVVWGDLGKQMTKIGIIDKEKFEALYSRRGGLNESMKALFEGENNKEILMTKENSGVILNLLWAFALVNKNVILEEGPMTDKKYGGAGRFASTGGWNLAVGNTMDYYSKHRLVSLTDIQQRRVENVSKNIYRPCCGNSVYFPDCNHGMAMLGLLELLASQDMSEEEMYQVALQVNSFWFPGTYKAIAEYFNNRGVEWNEIDAKEVLGASYSSAAGYRNIVSDLMKN